MMLPCLPSETEEISLIDGYSKQYHKTSAIPMMIIKLIVAFYSEILYIKINNNNTSQTKSIADRMKCEYTILWMDNLKCLIDVTYTDIIHSVVISTMIYNPEFKKFIPFYHLYTNKDDGLFSKSILDRYAPGIGHELHFRIKSQVLRAFDVDKNIIYDMNEDKMNYKVHYEWKLNDNFMDKWLNHISPLSAMSELFDNNYWMLGLERKTTGFNWDNYELSIFLQKLPKYVEEIEVEYHVKIIRDNDRNNIILNESRNECWKYDKDKKDTFSSIDIESDMLSISPFTSLTVIIDITLQKVYEIDHDEIPKKKWAAHNILV